MIVNTPVSYTHLDVYKRQYDANGALNTLTDGEGHQTQYTYNANGQLIQLTTVCLLYTSMVQKLSTITKIRLLLLLSAKI